MKTVIIFLLLFTSLIIHGQSSLLKQINIVQGVSFRTIPPASSYCKTKHTYDIGMGVQIVKLFNNNGIIVDFNFLRYNQTKAVLSDSNYNIKMIKNIIDIGFGYKRYFNKMFCSLTANPYYRFRTRIIIWGIKSVQEPTFDLASTLRIGYENRINSTSLKYMISLEYKVLQLLNSDEANVPYYPFYVGINIGLIKI